MSLELKIKSETLSFEAKYIRRNEKKQLARARKNKSSMYNSLYRHRMDVVRPEARATHLARGFIKETPYKVMEQSNKDAFRWSVIDPSIAKRVQELVWKYKPNRFHNQTKEQVYDSVKKWFETPSKEQPEQQN